jgi:serine/threonine protein kinase
MVKSNRTRKSLKGGKYLGKGSYGCAFRPPLKCVGEARVNDSYVTKLFQRPRPGEIDEAEKEWRKNMLVQREVDPEQKYFVTAIQLCTHDVGSVRKPLNNTAKRLKNGTMESCPWLLIPGQKLIRYPDAGIPLDSITLHADRYGFFLSSLINLWSGLVNLHKHNIVHVDIKPENTMSLFTPDGNYLTRFIDLGWSDPTSHFTPDSQDVATLVNFNTTQVYPWYPFDLCMAHQHFKKNLQTRLPPISQQLLDFWYGTVETSLGPYIYSGIPKDSFWSQSTSGQLFRKYDAKMLNGAILANTQFYMDNDKIFKSLDVYSLAITCCQVYSSVTGHYRILGTNGKPTIGIKLLDGYKYPLAELPVSSFKSALARDWHFKLAAFSEEFFKYMMECLHPIGAYRPTAIKCLQNFLTMFQAPALVPIFNPGQILSNPDATKAAMAIVGVKVQEPFVLSPIDPRPPSRASTSSSTASDPTASEPRVPLALRAAQNVERNRLKRQQAAEAAAAEALRAATQALAQKPVAPVAVPGHGRHFPTGAQLKQQQPIPPGGFLAKHLGNLYKQATTRPV